MKKNTMVILTISCVILIIMQVLTLTKLQRLNNKYDILTSEVSYLKNDINSIDSQIMTEVNRVLNSLEEQNSNIRNVTFKGLDMSDNNVIVRCDITLNNLEKGDIPYLLTKAKNEGNWSKFKLIRQNGLNYSVNVTLNPEKIYDYQLFIDGNVKKNTDIKPIPVYEYKYPDFAVEIGNYNPEEDNSNKRIVVNLFSKGKAVFQAMRFKNAKVLLYSDGVKIDSLDMMSIREYEESLKNRNKSEKNIERVERVKKIASIGALVAEIDFSQYSKKIDEIKVLVTYNNGHQITKTASIVRSY